MAETVLVDALLAFLFVALCAIVVLIGALIVSVIRER